MTPAGRLLCRMLNVHGMSCRGRSDHYRAGRWRKPHRLRHRLYFRLIDPWLMSLGWLLKRAGCRIVVGKGHVFVDPQPRLQYGYLDCHSCGYTVEAGDH